MSQPLLSLDDLIHNWSSRNQERWKQDANQYLDYGKIAIQLGQPSLAFDILNEGLFYFPQSTDMGYYAALALVNCGSLNHARCRIESLLERLSTHNKIRAQALALAGRIAKERWSKLPEGLDRRLAVLAAAKWYERAYQCSKDYFPGINAATMTFIAGEKATAQALAKEVQACCTHLPNKKENYWIAATLGEASLLLGEQETALYWYSKAVRLAGERYGDIASMWRQIKILAHHLPVSKALVETLATPNVAVFVGHMVDAPTRPKPRLPEALIPAVEKRICAAIDEYRIGVGYTSLACGSDILFVEQMLARGNEINVLLPFKKEDFIQTSVAFAGEHWVQRFEAVLKRVTFVSLAVDEGYLGDDILFKYTADLLQGQALLRAEHLGIDPLMFAVVDTNGGIATGGTLETLLIWQKRDRQVVSIDLHALRNCEPLPATTPTAICTSSEPNLPHNPQIWCQRQIKTMLFTDMVGFSRLSEPDAPSFIVHFLGQVAEVVRSNEPLPDFWNTWGDGLFLVFDKVVDATRIALRLRDAIMAFNWKQVGLPEDTNIRVGIHTGPVFPAIDPILNRGNFFGSHVNRAARIEPATAAGAVYVSRQTAALLAAENDTGMACDYLGEKVLAKGFGISALYRLRRSHEIE